MKKLAITILMLLVFSGLTFAQAKLTAEYAKRIKEATPKALPQTPVVPKLSSDAADENLKGKVKSVIEEHEDLSGTWKVQGRKFETFMDFDEKGNYLKRVYFDSEARPYNVAVYGYIDSKRVSKYEDILYGDELYVISADSENIDKNKPKPDNRYTYSYEYKHTDGKLAEMQMVLNTGVKGMRYNYNRSNIRMEKLAYSNDKLNQKYITVFDSKGYEIEWHVIAVINLPKPDTKYIIKNVSFDKQGNWTKRIYSEVAIANGKEVAKPDWAEYRTITYYP